MKDDHNDNTIVVHEDDYESVRKLLEMMEWDDNVHIAKGLFSNNDDNDSSDDDVHVLDNNINDVHKVSSLL